VPAGNIGVPHKEDAPFGIEGGNPRAQRHRPPQQEKQMEQPFAKSQAPVTSRLFPKPAAGLHCR